MSSTVQPNPFTIIIAKMNRYPKNECKTTARGKAIHDRFLPSTRSTENNDLKTGKSPGQSRMLSRVYFYLKQENDAHFDCCSPALCNYLVTLPYSLDTHNRSSLLFPSM